MNRRLRRILADPKLLGREGEWLAHRELLRLGFDVLTRNWQAPFGEVDLIARKDEALHFVEVKTRLQHPDHPPEESVTVAKREKYHSLAVYFLKEHGLRDISVRFHIAAVEFQPDGSHELTLHLNAF